MEGASGAWARGRERASAWPGHEWREANPGKEIDEAWWEKHIKEGGDPATRATRPKDEWMNLAQMQQEIGSKKDNLMSHAALIMRYTPDLGYQAANGTGKQHTWPNLAAPRNQRW